MAGLGRLTPLPIPEAEQQDYTCTTLGCPDPAVMRVPMNMTTLHPYGEGGQVGRMLQAGDEAPIPFGGDEDRLEMRLCRRCVRTLATALPPGKRLAGAVLRYPEVAPESRAVGGFAEASEEDWLAEMRRLKGAGETKARRLKDLTKEAEVVELGEGEVGDLISRLGNLLKVMQEREAPGRRVNALPFTLDPALGSYPLFSSFSVFQVEEEGEDEPR
jgi:hypothetical protein